MVFGTIARVTDLCDALAKPPDGFSIGHRFVTGDISINGGKSKTDQAKITNDFGFINCRFNLIKSVFDYRKNRSRPFSNGP